MKDGRNYTNFGKFTTRFGVKNLVLEMGRLGQTISVPAVYAWLSGISMPKPEHAKMIVDIAVKKEAILGFKLTLEDVYSHVDKMKNAI